MTMCFIDQQSMVKGKKPQTGGLVAMGGSVDQLIFSGFIQKPGFLFFH